MAIVGSTTNENGDALLISLNEPYTNVVEVLSYEDVVVGETTDLFYQKSFRWGVDGASYSDWVPLTNESLEALSLDPNNPFWIQYKYEQVGDGTLEFKSIALELVTDNGKICQIPQIQCCDGQTLSGSQNLAISCCESSWNPYDLSRPGQAYKQLASTVNNIFGFCVKYFKTEADQRSRDVILKEYSLFNVIQSDEIKILVPDNELPTRAIQFNPLMMDFPVQFEIHIVKSEFQKIFGIGSRPEMRDYLYFEQYMNRMYEIDAVAESDDFLYEGAYWRVSLVPYQQRAAVQYPDKNIEAEKDSIVTSLAEFEEERNNELADVRKPNQYNTIGTLANDYIRRILDKKLIIREEKVYNQWTVISKYHYDLSSMESGDETVVYRYTDGWTSSESRSFTAWVRPKYTNPIRQNILITGITDSGNGVIFETGGLPTSADRIKVGDWVAVKGTKSYNGIQQITAINGNNITLGTPYVDNLTLGTPRFNVEESNGFIRYENSNLPPDVQFLITYTPNWFIVKIGNVIHKFDLSQQGLTLIKDQWYGFVINMNNLANQLSLFIYETVAPTGFINSNIVASINNVYKDTKTVSGMAVTSGYDWKLIACKTDLTNIRLWRSPIEEEEQSNILTQYVVNDTHLTLLLDNAAPQLQLERVEEGR